MEPTSSLIIDRIVYTASLATNRAEINPYLNTLREVTARMDPAAPLSPSDQAKLVALQQELEQYLLTREQLRSFTAETLQLQIAQHMQGADKNKASRTKLQIVIGVSLAVATLAAILLPNIGNFEQRMQVAGATAFSLTTVGAAWLFLSALAAFKSPLRKAFSVISLGVTLLGLSLLEQPVIEVFDLRSYPLTSILYPLPILIAATCFHIGDTLYVRSVGIKNFWTTAWPVAIAGVLLSAATWILPHPPTSESELVHDIAASIWAWIMVMPIASAIILPFAVQKLPDLYKPSANALYKAMFPIIFVCVYQYMVRVIAGPYMDGIVAYTLFSLVFVMGLGLLIAGYTFNKVSKY